MTINKIISLLIITFAFTIKAQNTLPYAEENFCFDEAIKVNPSTIFSAKNLVVEKLTTSGSQKDVIVTDANNNLIKFYSFLPATGTFSFQNLMTVPGSGFGNGQHQAIDIGFFDSDLLPDLVFTTDSFIYVFTNNDNYNFSQSQKIAIITPFIAQEHYLKVDNINNNGFDEFYFISSTGTGLTIIPFNNLASNFIQEPHQNVFMSSSFLPASTFDISLGNIQNDVDGLKDVMLTYDQIADSVVFLENTSTASSISFNYHPTYLNPFPQASPDYYIKRSEMAFVNNDNKLDFVFIGNGAFGDKIKVYVGIVGFNLSFHVDIPTVCNFSDFKIGHINDDANVDFVGVGNVFGFSGAVVYPGNGDNVTYFNTSTTISLPLIPHPDELQLVDVDVNGLNDIVFKPWKNKFDHTYMISNHSFKVNVSPLVTTACSSQPAVIAATSISGSGNYIWKDTTNTIVANSSAFTTTQTGQYFAHLDLTMYSGAGCTRYSDTVQVNSSAPTIFVSNPNVGVCAGKISTVSAFGAVNYTWTSPSGTLNSVGSTFTVQNQVSETYTVFGENTNGCIGSNTVNVFLHQLNTDLISASKNPACVGDIVILSFPSATSYTWNNNNFNPTTAVSPSVTTNYQFTLLDTNGCKISKNIIIDVDPSCQPKIYTGITINGDNNNNIFRIDNIEKFSNNHVTIFNRWGKEIFTTSDYDNTKNFWPTADHLRTLTPSTYFYVVNFGNGEIQKGWVELISN